MRSRAVAIESRPAPAPGRMPAAAWAVLTESCTKSTLSAPGARPSRRRRSRIWMRVESSSGSGGACCANAGAAPYTQSARSSLPARRWPRALTICLTTPPRSRRDARRRFDVHLLGTLHLPTVDAYREQDPELVEEDERDHHH